MKLLITTHCKHSPYVQVSVSLGSMVCPITKEKEYYFSNPSALQESSKRENGPASNGRIWWQKPPWKRCVSGEVGAGKTTWWEIPGLFL